MTKSSESYEGLTIERLAEDAIGLGLNPFAYKDVGALLRAMELKENKRMPMGSSGGGAPVTGLVGTKENSGEGGISTKGRTAPEGKIQRSR